MGRCFNVARKATHPTNAQGLAQRQMLVAAAWRRLGVRGASSAAMRAQLLTHYSDMMTERHTLDVRAHGKPW